MYPHFFYAPTAVPRSTGWSAKWVILIILLMLVIALASNSFRKSREPLEYHFMEDVQPMPLTTSSEHSSAPQYPRQVPSTYVPTRFRRKRLTKGQKRHLLQTYSYRCGRCRKVLRQWDTEFDHHIPLAADRFGRFDLNHKNNWVPLCRACHGLKCFRERRAGLYTR